MYLDLNLIPTGAIVSQNLITQHRDTTKVIISGAQHNDYE